MKRPLNLIEDLPREIQLHIIKHLDALAIKHLLLACRSLRPMFLFHRWGLLHPSRFMEGTSLENFDTTDGMLMEGKVNIVDLAHPNGFGSMRTLLRGTYFNIVVVDDEFADSSILKEASQLVHETPSAVMITSSGEALSKSVLRLGALFTHAGVAGEALRGVSLYIPHFTRQPIPLHEAIEETFDESGMKRYFRYDILSRLDLSLYPTTTLIFEPKHEHYWSLNGKTIAATSITLVNACSLANNVFANAEDLELRITDFPTPLKPSYEGNTAPRLKKLSISAVPDPHFPNLQNNNFPELEHANLTIHPFSHDLIFQSDLTQNSYYRVLSGLYGTSGFMDSLKHAQSLELTFVHDPYWNLVKLERLKELKLAVVTSKDYPLVTFPALESLSLIVVCNELYKNNVPIIQAPVLKKLRLALKWDPLSYHPEPQLWDFDTAITRYCSSLKKMTLQFPGIEAHFSITAAVCRFFRAYDGSSLEHLTIKGITDPIFTEGTMPPLALNCLKSLTLDGGEQPEYVSKREDVHRRSNAIETIRITRMEASNLLTMKLVNFNTYYSVVDIGGFPSLESLVLKMPYINKLRLLGEMDSLKTIKARHVGTFYAMSLPVLRTMTTESLEKEMIDELNPEYRTKRVKR